MPRIKHKHLSRAQFEFLLDHMMETLPDHEITEWLQQFDDGLIEFVDRVPKEYKYSKSKGLYVE